MRLVDRRDRGGRGARCRRLVHPGAGGRWSAGARGRGAALAAAAAASPSSPSWRCRAARRCARVARQDRRRGAGGADRRRREPAARCRAGLRPGADRDAADAAPDHQPHRAGRLRQPGGARGAAAPAAGRALRQRASARRPSSRRSAATLADGERAAGRFTAHPGPRALLRGAGRAAAAGRRLRPRGAGDRADRGPDRGAARRGAALGLHRQRQPRAAARRSPRSSATSRRCSTMPATTPRRASGSSAIMAREAGRMQRLVDDLMSLSRIEMTEHVRPVEEWSLEPRSPPRAPRRCCRSRASRASTLEIDLRRTGATRARRPRPAGAGLRQPDRQRDEVRRRRHARCGCAPLGPDKAHPSRDGVAVEDDGPGIAARAPAPADRALLPGQRRHRAATRAAPVSGSRSSSTS